MSLLRAGFSALKGVVGNRLRRVPADIGTRAGLGRPAGFLDHVTNLPTKQLEYQQAMRALKPRSVIPGVERLRDRRYQKLLAEAKETRRGALFGAGASVGRGARAIKNKYDSATGAGMSPFSGKHLLMAGGAGAALGMLKSSSAMYGDTMDEMLVLDPRVLGFIIKQAYPNSGAAPVGSVTSALGGAAPPKRNIPKSVQVPGMQTGVKSPAANLGKKRQFMPPAYDAPSPARVR